MILLHKFNLKKIKSIEYVLKKKKHLFWMSYIVKYNSK